MTSILNSLFVKSVKVKTLYVLLAIAVLLPLLSTVLSYLLLQVMLDSIPELSGELQAQLELLGIEMTSKSFVVSEVSAESTGMLLAMIGSILVLGSEFTNGTIKNALSANKSRTQIFFAYILYSVVVFIVLSLTYLLSTLAFSSMFFGYGGSGGFTQELGEMLTYIALTALIAVAVASLSFMFLTLFQKKAGAIVMSYVTLIVVSFVTSMMLELFADYTGGVADYTLSYKIAEWLPITQTLMLASGFDTGIVLKTILTQVLAIGLFGSLAYWRLRRCDFK